MHVTHCEYTCIISLKMFIFWQSFDLPPFMSKYVSAADGSKDAEIGSRGQNKVSALAKDLASKFSAEKTEVRAVSIYH